jgi:PAS domain-containing protein
LAICSLHFIGMSAVSILADTTIVAPPMAVSADWLAVWVAGAAIALLLASVTGLLVGQRRSEERRLLELADAAIEGLAVCEDGLIVTVNTSLARMLGLPAAQLIGKRLASLIDGEIPDCSKLRPDTHFEAQIRSPAGTQFPSSFWSMSCTLRVSGAWRLPFATSVSAWPPKQISGSWPIMTTSPACRTG